MHWTFRLGVVKRVMYMSCFSTVSAVQNYVLTAFADVRFVGAKGRKICNCP
jgi:hypothetical protein